MSARTRWCFVLSVACTIVAPLTATAQRAHVLIVAGLSGEPAFRTTFLEAATTVRDAARTRWGVNDSSLIVLTEDSLPSALSRGRATRDAVARAFTTLSTRVQAGDILLVFLLGHGSGEGPNSRVNLPGPDATAADYKTWLAGFSRQSVVFVNAATGSGDFVPVLAAPGRVVVTATKSAIEKNASVFAAFFARALSGDEADDDKDARISVLEAYRFAQREVAKTYEGKGLLQTEHSVISDSARARTVSFGKVGAAASPRVAALIAERQALESEVAALRERKASMAADAYDAELERLLLAIAEKTQAIRAAGGTP
jgi:hypothetical protein